AKIEITVFLVEIRAVEKQEEAAKDVEILDLLVVGNPAVAQALENQADAVHLAVGAAGAPERPAEAVGADEVGHHLDVFLGVGAERGELAVAHAAVGVELEGGAGEDERQHAVEIEITAEAAGGVVEEASRAGL